MLAAVRPDGMIRVEDESSARRWLIDELGVSRETMLALEQLNSYVLAEAKHQNLIAASTLSHMWQRHIVDSAQLLRFARPQSGQIWMDLGSGAGFPGLVIALMTPCHVVLVESRALRVRYLERAIDLLGLNETVTVAGSSLDRVPDMKAHYISARAFAPLPKLLDMAARFSTENTRWLLPKGRNAATELESVSIAWQRVFHVEQSLTDVDAAILVGTGRAAPVGVARKSSDRHMRQHRSRS